MKENGSVSFTKIGETMSGTYHRITWWKGTQEDVETLENLLNNEVAACRRKTKNGRDYKGKDVLQNKRLALIEAYLKEKKQGVGSSDKNSSRKLADEKVKEKEAKKTKKALNIQSLNETASREIQFMNNLTESMQRDQASLDRLVSLFTLDLISRNPQLGNQRQHFLPSPPPIQQQLFQGLPAQVSPSVENLPFKEQENARDEAAKKEESKDGVFFN